jgi:hypothetical protein
VPGKFDPVDDLGQAYSHQVARYRDHVTSDPGSELAADEDGVASSPSTPNLSFPHRLVVRQGQIYLTPCGAAWQERGVKHVAQLSS